MQNNIDLQPFPTGTSDEAFLTDFEGVSRVLTIQGYYKSSFANLKTFVDNLEAIQNGTDSEKGSEQDDIPLVLTMRDTNLRVVVQRLDIEWDIPSLGKVSYTLELLEGLA